VIARARELRLVYSRGRVIAPPVRIGQPADAATLLMDRLRSEPVEVCCLVLLNTRHEVVATHELSRGTLDSCSVGHPRNTRRSSAHREVRGKLQTNQCAIVSA
jgi:DNA repair protein RadC